MSNFWDVLPHGGGRLNEYLNGNAEKMQRLRQEVKTSFEDLQLITTVTLVVTVVSVLFTIMTGGILGTFYSYAEHSFRDYVL